MQEGVALAVMQGVVLKAHCLPSVLICRARVQASLAGKGIFMLTVTSPAFQKGAEIPDKYSCRGENINPELDIAGVPPEAKSLVLIMDDPDAPIGTFTHWVLWNINPADPRISENSIPEGTVEGNNSLNKASYAGPCPPSGTHRYYFKFFALDNALALPKGSDRVSLEREMDGHVLAQGQLMGRFSH